MEAPSRHPVILLVSGGIDSYVAWHYLGKPTTLYFRAHHRYMDEELAAIMRLIPDTIMDDSLNLADREVGVNAYIPFRNLLFALQAVRYSDSVCIAGLKDDVVEDKNEQVFHQWSELMSAMMGRAIRVFSPFWGMCKHEVVAWYKENVGNVSKLAGDCVSCYTPGSFYCGKCPACFRKWCALCSNGYTSLGFHNRQLAVQYYERALEGEYQTERNKNIISCVETLILKK